MIIYNLGDYLHVHSKYAYVNLVARFVFLFKKNDEDQRSSKNELTMCARLCFTRWKQHTGTQRFLGSSPECGVTVECFETIFGIFCTTYIYLHATNRTVRCSIYT